MWLYLNTTTGIQTQKKAMMALDGFDAQILNAAPDSMMTATRQLIDGISVLISLNEQTAQIHPQALD